MLHFTSKSTWTKALSLSFPQACNHSAQDSGGDWQVAREPIQRAGRPISGHAAAAPVSWNQPPADPWLVSLSIISTPTLPSGKHRGT